MISYIIPVFDEEESLEAFYKELKNVADSLSQLYEIIFIDDGSRDKTLEHLLDLEKKDNKVGVFSFRRNHGKAEALTFGFQKAKGDLIITLDADLQDKPTEIKKLLDKQKEGFDVVSGWRKKRKDSFAKIIFSKSFNFVARVLWGIKLHDYNCGLKIYTKDVAKELNLYGGMHRFIPLLASDAGFRVTEVAVEHDVRRYGVSKYSAWKVLTQMPDMMSMFFLSKFGKKPLHLFGFVGLFLFLAGFLVSLYLSIEWFLGVPIGGRPLFFLGILLILVGIQISLTGLVADLILNVANRNQSGTVVLKYPKE